ncbi:hypothetical protein ACL02S_22225 [Nocardia sp. 004]|uniref:hypothetical protein n=1 Tax=Nocardia sp. 004 TaxID=3385978 RepID=UPI0039A20BD9
MSTRQSLTLEERRAYMDACSQLLRAVQRIDNDAELQRKMTYLRIRSLEASRLPTSVDAVRVLQHRIESERLLRVLETVFERRMLASRWWLHDAIDPASPSVVRGLPEALPERRKQIDEQAEAGEQTRAGLRYQQRCTADSPGRLVTARRRVPRGPNPRLLTENSQ